MKGLAIRAGAATLVMFLLGFGTYMVEVIASVENPEPIVRAQLVAILIYQVFQVSRRQGRDQERARWETEAQRTIRLRKEPKIQVRDMVTMVLIATGVSLALTTWWPTTYAIVGGAVLMLAEQAMLAVMRHDIALLKAKDKAGAQS